MKNSKSPFAHVKYLLYRSIIVTRCHWALAAARPQGLIAMLFEETEEVTFQIIFLVLTLRLLPFGRPTARSSASLDAQAAGMI